MHKNIHYFLSGRYVDRLEVNYLAKRQHAGQKAHSVFPVNRWIDANSQLMLSEYDSLLPVDDMQLDQREKELRARRETYTLSEKILGAPLQVGCGNLILVTFYSRCYTVSNSSLYYGMRNLNSLIVFIVYF